VSVASTIVLQSRENQTTTRTAAMKVINTKRTLFPSTKARPKKVKVSELN
jgi:hypothetical protein